MNKKAVFVAYWTVTINVDVYRNATTIRETMSLIASKRTVDTLFNTATCVVGGFASAFTHEYEYNSIKGGRYGSQLAISSIRTIRANLDEWPKQRALVKEIIEKYQASPNRTAVCCIYGPSGSGKSTVACMIASELRGKLTDVDFLENAEVLETSYTEIGSSATMPVVYRYDEIDAVIDKIIKKTAIDNEAESKSSTDDRKFTMVEMQIEAERFSRSGGFPTKRDWTSLLDRITEGFFPHAIFIFTTNRDLTWYDEKDASLFRNGRFTVRRCLD